MYIIITVFQPESIFHDYRYNDLGLSYIKSTIQPRLLLNKEIANSVMYHVHF